MASSKKRLRPDGRLLNTALPKRVYILSDPGSIFRPSPSSASSSSPSSSSSSSDDDHMTTTSSTVQDTMHSHLYGFKRNHSLSTDSTMSAREAERSSLNMRETEDSSSMMNMREAEHSTSGMAHLRPPYNKESHSSCRDPSGHKKLKGNDNWFDRDASRKQSWMDSEAEVSDLTCEMNHKPCGYDLNSSMLHEVVGEPYVNTRIHGCTRDLGFLNSRSSPLKPKADIDSSGAYGLPKMVIDSGRHLERDTKWSYVIDKMESSRGDRELHANNSFAEDTGSRRGFSSLFPTVGRAFTTSTQNTYTKAKSLMKSSLGQSDGGGGGASSSTSSHQESPCSSQGSSPPRPRPPSYVLSSGRKSLEEG